MKGAHSRGQGADRMTDRVCKADSLCALLSNDYRVQSRTCGTVTSHNCSVSSKGSFLKTKMQESTKSHIFFCFVPTIFLWNKVFRHTLYFDQVCLIFLMTNYDSSWFPWTWQQPLNRAEGWPRWSRRGWPGLRWLQRRSPSSRPQCSTGQRGRCHQRPKKSEFSGWQLSTRKNFPDKVHKLFSRPKNFPGYQETF